MALNFLNFTKSYALSQAAGYERLAYYWAEKESDLAFLERIRFTPQSAEYQSKLAASHAADWYEKSRRVQS